MINFENQKIKKNCPPFLKQNKEGKASYKNKK